MKFFVLVKIEKSKTHRDEFNVQCLYSDKEKNFKRIAECTPEIQAMACKYSNGVFEVLDDRNTPMYSNYFDCETLVSVVAPKELPIDWNKRKLVLDTFTFDVDFDWPAFHVVNHFASQIHDFGNADNGKVFMKCGRNAKVEISFTVEGNKIDEVLEDFLAA